MAKKDTIPAVFCAAPAKFNGREVFAVQQDGWAVAVEIGSNPIEKTVGAGIIVGITDWSSKTLGLQWNDRIAVAGDPFVHQAVAPFLDAP